MSAEPKTVADAAAALKSASAYVLDIEGTTTSISFVKETLFPYVRTNLSAYLQEKWSEASFQEVLKKLVEQSKADVEAKMEGAVALDDEEESPEKAQDAVKSSVLWMMDADRKVGALKTLQGQMYVKGYEAGDLKGHVYSDVVPQMKKWTEDGKKLYIYSSGSVEAQKLLFGHTTEGDVTTMIADYFDTEVGAKVEKESYVKIAEKIGKPVAEVLFFTDVVKEADAAKEAGMSVILMEREGNAPLTEEDKAKYPVLSTFKMEEEEEEVPAKKQKLEEEKTEETPAPTTTTTTTTEEKTEKVEEKTEDVEMKSTENGEAEKTNGTNGVHENGTNGTEEKTTNGTNGTEKETNGTNGTEEKETNGTEEKTKVEEVVAEKIVSPTKKVVTEEGAEDAPKEVVAE